MIKNLNGEFETVEYDEKKYVMFYDNTDNEPYPVHWHNAVEFIMPLKNHYIVNVAGTDFDFRENEVLIVPPGELHSMPAIPGRRLIFQCDNSILGEIPALEAIMRSMHSPLIINSDYDREIHALAKKMMLDAMELYSSHSEVADVKIYMGILSFLLALREHQLQEQKASLECDDDQLDEYTEKFGTVMKYIDSNYMYDLTLDQLADVAGYSKYHFSRIFKQYNSMSYIQYINARRTKAAEQLLLDPDLPITEVAMRSGFKSLTTFNRIFKDIKHCTPTDFKRLCQSNLTDSL
ncbi:MAG: helix-turn-helix transcriptional regulator [Ruminococcus sp.]|nr:helix-turn-helix transcriptional regulator [Ruminococcus sp.]